jgi:N-hydroxyarylamine O-acetyltransferase
MEKHRIMLDVEAYLRRIGFQGDLAPDEDTLRRLHRAHLLAVPFENLDICDHRPLTLDEGGLVRKIVERRRGGFCYELNGLLAALLRAVGFQVTLLGAHVVRGQDIATLDLGSGPFTDHLILLVELEERWLADVGFGSSPVEPLRLDTAGVQVQGATAYRISPHAGVRLLSQREEDVWQPQYVFSLQPRVMEDFAEDCARKQASPSWNERPRCSLATAEGRVTVTEDQLITTTNGQRREQPLHDHAAYVAALRDYCGVELATHTGDGQP